MMERDFFLEQVVYNSILLKRGYLIISYTTYHGLMPLSGFDCEITVLRRMVLRPSSGEPGSNLIGPLE